MSSSVFCSHGLSDVPEKSIPLIHRFFAENHGAVSGEQDERFHQDNINGAKIGRVLE